VNSTNSKKDLLTICTQARVLFMELKDDPPKMHLQTKFPYNSRPLKPFICGPW